MPFMDVLEASSIASTMSLYLAGFMSLHVRSTTETSGVGTRKAIPVSFLSKDGITFSDAQRPPRQSLPPRDGPSTVSWVAVIACTVVISPSLMPNLSFTTFASGARQLVVHEALLTTFKL